MADLNYGGAAIDPNDPFGLKKQNQPIGGSAQTQAAVVNAPTQANPSNIPLMQQGNQNQLLQLTPEALQMGNSAVLGKAQQSALQQQNTGQNQYSQPAATATMNLMQNPLGFDKNQYLQAQKDAFNRSQAEALAAYRSQNADTANTGTTQNQLLTLALQGAQKGTENQQNLQQQLGQQEFTNRLSALSSARAGEKQTADLYTQMLQNLGLVRGMGEGERAQTTENQQQMAVLETVFGQDMAKLLQTQNWTAAQNQIGRDLELAMQKNDITATAANLQKQIDLDKWKQQNGQEFSASQNALNRALEVQLKNQDFTNSSALMKLKSQIDTGMLVRQQDFQAVQADLDRRQQIAVQKGDIQGQKEIETLRGQINAAAQNEQRKWQSAERIATQSWTSEERLSQNDFDSAQKYLDRQQQSALQKNDMSMQLTLQNMRSSLELKKQTNDMDQQTKMAYLGAELEEAKASKDFNRQKQIIQFTTQQDMAKITQQQGYEAAQAELDRRFRTATQEKDIAAQQSLQQTQIALERERMVMDSNLKQAELQLQKQGVDLATLQGRYDAIKDASGPDAARAYLTGVMAQNGITVQQPDPMASQRAIMADYNDQQLQYALTHKSEANWGADGSFRGLNDTGAARFTTWYNDSIYGVPKADQYLSGDLPITDLVGKTGSAEYKALLARAPTFDNNAWPTDGGFFKFEGKLYQIQTNLPDNYSEWDAIDVSTGQRIMIGTGAGLDGQPYRYIKGKPGSMPEQQPGQPQSGGAQNAPNWSDQYINNAEGGI